MSILYNIENTLHTEHVCYKQRKTDGGTQQCLYVRQNVILVSLKLVNTERSLHKVYAYRHCVINHIMFIILF